MTINEKAELVRELSDRMKEQFLAKLDRIPSTWDGIEIRTWMANEWAREGYSRLLKGKRGKEFHSAIYNNNL
jgi:hypothetical protein